MDRYSRMLLYFIHSLAGGLDRVEAFLFATRLTRITRQLVLRGVDDWCRPFREGLPTGEAAPASGRPCEVSTSIGPDGCWATGPSCCSSLTGGTVVNQISCGRNSAGFSEAAIA